MNTYLFLKIRLDEEDLVLLVGECCRGEELTIPTMQLVNRLRRPLPPGEQPVRLYVQNYDVDVYNAQSLMKMPGVKVFLKYDI